MMGYLEDRRVKIAAAREQRALARRLDIASEQN